MKVIIAGSRGFNNRMFLFDQCDHYLINSTNIEIVSGGAKGADKFGESYASARGLKLTVFPADWENYGKMAGYIRNKSMAEYADALIAFWDGKSAGTRHMINIAKQKGLKIRVIEYMKSLSWRFFFV